MTAHPKAQMSDLYLPSSRYVLPQMEERTSYGFKRMDPYNKLFEERIIFLGAPIDDTSANDVMAQLLTLESADPDRDITIYINSPGGSFTSLMAIYDTMMFVRPDIQTVCMGQAASAAAVLLAAGTPGKRLALPYSRVLIHQPSGESGGQVSDLEIHAAEIQRVRSQMEEILARHTGQAVYLWQPDTGLGSLRDAHVRVPDCQRLGNALRYMRQSMHFGVYFLIGLELPLSAMDATLLRQLARAPKEHLRRVVLIDAPAALVEHLGDLAVHLGSEDSQPRRLRLRDGRWLV